jgi:small GTP-binding protein
MRTLNIGILAHVDAGKTSLTERLLFDHGTLDRLGSVDAGDTRTDDGGIERRRGITIRSAVAAFTVGDTRVNLIDTPGHSDFVAEVERALEVLDGAVLLLSAVEGVQARTRVLMRTLRRLRLPTLVFVNKIDRAGARTDGLLDDVRRLLTPHVAPLTEVTGAGTPHARVARRAPDERTAQALAEVDPGILAALVDGPSRRRGIWPPRSPPGPPTARSTRCTTAPRSAARASRSWSRAWSAWSRPPRRTRPAPRNRAARSSRCARDPPVSARRTSGCTTGRCARAGGSPSCGASRTGGPPRSPAG